MPATLKADAQAAIDRIDALYDANRDALLMRLRLNLSVTGHGLDINAWHNAWRRCPDLQIKGDALMLQRGRLQQVRDAAINREWQAQQRRERAAQRKANKIAATKFRPCTICSGSGYQLAVTA